MLKQNHYFANSLYLIPPDVPEENFAATRFTSSFDIGIPVITMEGGGRLRNECKYSKSHSLKTNSVTLTYF